MVKGASAGQDKLFLISDPRDEQRTPGVAIGEAVDAEVVLAGRRYRLVPVEQQALCKSDLRPPAKCPPVADLLTARELQIATLVADGLINKQIADRLGISDWTVSTHLRRIFVKLRVETRAAMVCRCMVTTGE
jgi:DNA-binding NarL/FixJ family response regulator